MSADEAGRPERREILELLPWHAAGTLAPEEAARVEAALATDPDLAREFERAREELGGAVDANEALGRPSPRAMDALFEKIDAEPARSPSARGLLEAIGAVIAGLGPRTLAWSAAAAALLIVVQATVIGVGAVADISTGKGQQLAGGPGTTAGGDGAFAHVQFKPTATMADVEKALRAQGATIVDGPKGGLYRVRLPAADAGPALARLQADKTVATAFAEPAPR